ncbi:hypothetical protein CBC_0842 [Clostridium botulinum C str. Eklund]|nr:hypothetical protein CBC_0842 [Clostridium botulinum C str. Eklund]
MVIISIKERIRLRKNVVIDIIYLVIYMRNKIRYIKLIYTSSNK